MGDDEDDPAGVGEAAQRGHDLPVERRVEAGGGFVEDQQRRSGEQFEGDRRAFALPPGEAVDPGAGVLGELEFAEHPGDHLVAVGTGGVRWQPQFGGVAEGLTDGELPVEHVVLGNETDPGAQRLVFGVHAVAVELHDPVGGIAGAGDDLGHGGFARAGGADDGGERAGRRGQGDVVQ